MALEEESQTRTFNQDFTFFCWISWWSQELIFRKSDDSGDVRHPVSTDGKLASHSGPKGTAADDCHHHHGGCTPLLFKATRSTFPNLHHQGCTLFLFKPAHLTFANFKYHGCTPLSTLDNHTPLDQRAPVTIFTALFLFVFASSIFFRAYYLKHLTLHLFSFIVTQWQLGLLTTGITKCHWVGQILSE